MSRRQAEYPVKTKSVIGEVLTVRTIRLMADAKSLQRGEDYLAAGRVRSIRENDDVVKGEVGGTESYRVSLWAEENRLAHSCSCPMGQAAIFCKHCVALGLAWLNESGGGSGAGKKREKPRPSPEADARAWLSTQTQDILIELVMERFWEDDVLRRRLEMKAAAADPKGPDLNTYRKVFDKAVAIRDFVDYRGASGYVRGVDAAIDGIEELLGVGCGAETMELAEHALAAVERAIGQIDDSDGGMGPLLGRLQEIHLAASLQAKPDPEKLARMLFHWENTGEWDTFRGAARTYAKILGPKGLALHRKLAEAEWAKVPVLKPGQEKQKWGGNRFRITSIMETVAEMTGDADQLVAVMERDLSCAYNYLKIAEIYKTAGKFDLALEWAERGVNAFPVNTDRRLREFLADEYQRLKRPDEAIALIWAEFAERSTLEHYMLLKKHADQCGQWPAWREKALAELREGIRRDRARKPGNPWAPDHSVLVRIFLWEKDPEAAWREAQTGGCGDHLWLELAAMREKDFPADALAVYRSRVAPTLEQGNNEAYKTAVEYMKKVRKLMARVGTEADFLPWAAQIETQFKRKRNFIKLLDKAKW